MADSDPTVRLLLAELVLEYYSRYGDDKVLAEYPIGDFSPPAGVFLLLFEEDVLISSGALRRFDEATAELKRVWTHPAHRRRGLARHLLVELEHRAAAIGYDRVYLTTGPRQPEAIRFYLANGYVPLFNLEGDLESIGALPFEKSLRSTK